MKYKYTFLKNRLFYDEILIPYLDKMSKKDGILYQLIHFLSLKNPHKFINIKLTIIH